MCERIAGAGVQEVRWDGAGVRRTRVRHGNVVDLVRVQPNFLLAAAKNGRCKALL